MSSKLPLKDIRPARAAEGAATFWTATQNNSGGSFDHDPEHGIGYALCVEAHSAEEATTRCEQIVDGYPQGGDCPCCGDRWSFYFGEGGGDPEPSLYGEPLRGGWGLPSYVPLLGRPHCGHCRREGRLVTLHTPLNAALHRTPAGECRLIVAADETALLDPDDAHEAAREWALEEFADWQRGDYERREFEDFGAWLARMSQPHIRDHEKFALAMTYAERGASEFLRVAKGHKQFVRQGGVR